MSCPREVAADPVASFCLGGALLGPLERNLRGQASPQIVPLLLALITLETAAQLVRGINLGQHHVTAYNVATLVQRGVLLGGVVALTLARSLVLPRVLLSWGIATALSLAVSGVWIWWRSPAVTMSACHLLKGWQVSFARGFRALITITATFVLLRFDWWVLGPVLGSKAVGQISVATAIAEWLWYVPTILGSILFALVAADRSDAAVWKVARATRGVAAVVLPVAVILMLVGRYLVPAIYGDAYREAGRVLVVLAPGVAAIAVHLVADSYFAGSGFPLVSWAGALGALGVKVLLNALLVPIAGILGAAAATSTAYSCLLALKVWRLGRERGVSARDLLVLNRGDITYGLTAARAWVGERVHSA